MLLLFTGLAKSFKKGPIATGAGRFFEPIVVYIRDEIAIPNIGEKHYKRYMSFLLTVFFFVWFLNLFGLTPLGINVTGNIAVTFALALLTFLSMRRAGQRNRGAILGAISLFLGLALVHTTLVDLGLLSSPYLISFFFLAIALVTSYQLAAEVARASVLSEKVRSDEMDFRPRWESTGRGSIPRTRR